MANIKKTIMKTLLSLLLIITFSKLTIAQTTAIPDANFEQALIYLGYDTVPDGQVLTSNISGILTLNISALGISDLSGIESFDSLRVLYCVNNGLTSINVTQNTALTHLDVFSNNLISLDVSQNTLLQILQCESNQLTSLDITNNIELLDLQTQSNNLTNLDVSQNTKLTHLYCTNTNLSSLDVSQNTNLVTLWCDNNPLSCLNVKENQITELRAKSNPNLTCIEVNDVAWSTSNWTTSTGGNGRGSIDAITSFSSYCQNACSAPCSISANYTTTNNNNGNYSFTNTSTGNFYNVHWAFGDGSTSTTISPNHAFNANGTYVVVLTINDSASGGICFDYIIDTIIVSSVPNPTQCSAGFVMYPDTSSGNITVVNSSTGSNLTYLWSFGDGNTSTLQSPTHTYATSGPFYLCLTVDDGSSCNDTYCDSIGSNGVVFKQAGFTINVIPASSIITDINKKNGLNSEVEIYPNPTSNQLTIGTEQNINEIKIVDITGKIIMITKENTRTINVTNLSDGIYFIKLNTDQKTMIKKFVKH